MLSRLARSAATVVRRRGLTYLWYVATGVVLPTLAWKLYTSSARRMARPAARLLGALALPALAMLAWWTERWFVVGAVGAFAVTGAAVSAWFYQFGWIHAARRRARQLSNAPDRSSAVFTDWRALPFDQRARHGIEAALSLRASQELVVGEIDHDGRVLPLFGDIPGLPSVSAEYFLPRKRYALSVVIWEARDLLIRKNFGADGAGLVGEWLALATLDGRASIPALHHVDEQFGMLYRNAVLGKTVRELLVAAGAEILHAQTDGDASLAGLSASDRMHAIVARGRGVIRRSVDARVLDALEDAVNAIHGAGITGASTTYGNVVIDASTGAPVLIDLEGSTVHRSTRSTAWRLRRDEDRIKLNNSYQMTLLTERSAREALRAQARKNDNWYAPIDFGGGVVVGGFWSTDSGSGRWECLNRRTLGPLLPGKRILDLGSNNGLMPMMMLRDGSREVLGLELSAAAIDASRLVHRVFEWRDNRKYALTIQRGNMLEILGPGWPSFDMVTAFCSLYYLEPKDMGRVVRRAAELAPIMVIQANVATRDEAAAEKSQKSSVPFLQRLLEANGFPRVEITAPKGFSRPILVGYSDG